jgi:hypothetical protein
MLLFLVARWFVVSFLFLFSLLDLDLALFIFPFRFRFSFSSQSQFYSQPQPQGATKHKTEIPKYTAYLELAIRKTPPVFPSAACWGWHFRIFPCSCSSKAAASFVSNIQTACSGAGHTNTLRPGTSITEPGRPSGR